jgi:hypothetical protein
MRGLPLASVDRASGVLISDKVEGFSDHRYWGTEGHPVRMLPVRFKYVVRVRATTGGARVGVELYEETNYPKEVRFTTSAHRPFHPFDSHRAFPSSAFDVERHHWTVRDRWVPTPSSTAREKALLDRIEGILGTRDPRR